MIAQSAYSDYTRLQGTIEGMSLALKDEIEAMMILHVVDKGYGKDGHDYQFTYEEIDHESQPFVKCTIDVYVK